MSRIEWTDEDFEELPGDAGREIAELAQKWSDRCERAEAAVRELKSLIGGVAGTLDTPTQLSGRDEATQLAEFRRRVAQAVVMLDRLAEIDTHRRYSADW